MKVLYIMSSGRSGSTIMNTVLGNHPQMFACGELCHIAHPHVQEILCSCGTLFPHCPVWSKVLSELNRVSNSRFLEQYLSLQQYFEIYRTPYDMIENSLTRFMMTMHRLRGLPGKDRQRFSDYTDMSRLLFQTIADVSEKSIIVDSSKNFLRANWLSNIPEIDLYILHMVRDGRGVVAATKKSLPNEEKRIGWSVKPKPVWRTTIAWTKTNLMLDHHLNHSTYNSLSIRYDDFAQRPIKTLETIGTWLQIDMNVLTGAINNGTVLPPGHTMAGNAGRMKPVKNIAYDDKWKQSLSKFERVQFACIGGYLNRKYGYK